MTTKAITVKQYAKMEGVEYTSTIYNRISRGTLKSIKIDGHTYVYPKSDKTIKKPRRK